MKQMRKPKITKKEKGYLFISYSKEDNKKLPIIYYMINELTKYKYNVWYDKGVDIDENFNNKIADRLENAEIIVLFISDHSVRSKYVQAEVAYATSLNKKIFGILLDGTKNYNDKCTQVIDTYDYRSESLFFKNLIHMLDLIRMDRQ